MLWIAVAAAAQLSAALPVNYSRWWSPDDVPASVRTQGVTREVPYRAVIRPDGTLDHCEVEQSSGDTSADAITCSTIMKRGKYLPARWIDGSPAYGVDRVVATWRASPEAIAPKPIGPDIELAVNELPAGVSSPAGILVAVAVDEKGQLESCVADPPRWLGQPQPNATLVQVACDEVMKNFKATPVRDAGGQAVRSIQTVSVLFSRSK
jgi:hypothetical protein